MNLQVTSWGSIQPVYAHNGEIISEIVTFTSNGNPHKHDNWEICMVIKGYGYIHERRDGAWVIHEVTAGSIVFIPPDAHHFMKIDEGTKGMVIVIGYTHEAKYHID